MKASMAARLGVEPGPTRELTFDLDASADGNYHGFAVAYAQGPSGPSPRRLLITTFTSALDGDRQRLDGYIFLASLEGKPLRVIHNSGTPGAITSAEVPLDPRLRKTFNDELRFFRAKAR